MRRWLEDFFLNMWLHKGVLSTVLVPLSWLYAAIAKYNLQRQQQQAWRAPVPVIVVGNILLGGTGKTPVTIALTKKLVKLGWQPGIVSRGYGIQIGDEPHLSSTCADSKYLGDEPALLFAATGQAVAVHPKRVLAAQDLLREHPEVNLIIADDGLQHLSLARDIEIIVQDQRGAGNGRLIPAGPLRQPAYKLDQADYIITNANKMAKGINTKQILMQMQAEGVVHLASGKTCTWQDWLRQYQDTTINAMAGIGQPDRFFNMLRQNKLNLNATVAIADHKKIGPELLKNMSAQPILITAKDAVKLDKPIDSRFWQVNASPVFSDANWVENLSEQLKAVKID